VAHKVNKCPHCGAVSRPRQGLTSQQLKLLRILERSKETPSYQEMVDRMGLASKSGITRLILSLEERGFIERMPHRARSIRVIA
jgi:repressor LexA